MKKVLVLGSDGYIGYPLTLHLTNKGYEVIGLDNYSRRERVKAIGGDSLTPIEDREEVCETVHGYLGRDSYSGINKLLSVFKPDVIVHLAEMPSAPWSMIDSEHAYYTQRDNVLGTLDLLWAMREECPDAHLIKIGTMGEYGTPNCDIPEGLIPNEPCEHYIAGDPCPMRGLLFPRQPGSFYHLSKVHDTFNIKFACDTWGLSSTDIMQGVLFGVKVTGDEEENELTRFDYDEYFGTVINRFCVQALAGIPLTVYGKGNQKRGFLPLKDSIQCLTLAIENPPAKGEYRTWNQFENVYSINKLTQLVQEAANNLNIKVEIDHIKNPRFESEDHYYNPTCQTLFSLGYKPTENIKEEIYKLLYDLLPYQDRIIKSVIMPKTTWR